MPSPSTSPVTLPNRVSTPTFPVGIDVVLEKQDQQQNYDDDAQKTISEPGKVRHGTKRAA
jgi:hypothetical protein